MATILTPAQLLNPQHPVHGSFVAWVIRKHPTTQNLTKRQARKFLQQFPTLRRAA